MYVSWDWQQSEQADHFLLLHTSDRPNFLIFWFFLLISLSPFLWHRKWKLFPYWAFALLGWYGFAYFWSKTTFINGGHVFQGLWQCRVLNTAMLVLRERTTLPLNKISVFFFSFAFLVCVCLCSRKKKWTSRCPLLRSLVYLRSLFWCFTKSDKINNYWKVKAVFCFLSKSANSFKAWKTTTICSINKYQD